MAPELGPAKASAILDTSVLINFLVLDHADLLGSDPDYRFLVTNHVRGEVTDAYPAEVTRLDRALEAALLLETELTAAAEVELFARLSANPRFGPGECAAMAAAIERQFTIAIEEKPAIRLLTSEYPKIAIQTTKDIVLRLIRGDILTVAEADVLKEQWEQHRFRLRFRSFRELL